MKDNCIPVSNTGKIHTLLKLSKLEINFIAVAPFTLYNIQKETKLKRTVHIGI
jgi:hypothetical protein